jgi:three-Cys-motif partner protein
MDEYGEKCQIHCEVNVERAIDLWHDLCEKYREPDGLPTWEEAGRWTEDKLYFWKKYIDITAKAMCGQRGRRAFPDGLVYVDLFAGAGICTLKGRSKRRLPGSAIIAAHAPRPFEKIIVCEKDPSLAAACRKRLASTQVADRCEVLVGDCNQLVAEVVRRIPNRALTLAFVDPKGLDAQFSTVAQLSNGARVDFVLLFADAYDINRNVEHVYRSDVNSKLDQVLGPDSNWRQDLDTLEHPNHATRRKLFTEIYKRQLRRLLGFEFFGEKVMACKKLPLYRLVYASHSDLGLKFWRDALLEDSGGQRDLFD